MIQESIRNHYTFLKIQSTFLITSYAILDKIKITQRKTRKSDILSLIINRELETGNLTFLTNLKRSQLLKLN